MCWEMRWGEKIILFVISLQMYLLCGMLTYILFYYGWWEAACLKSLMLVSCVPRSCAKWSWMFGSGVPSCCVGKLGVDKASRKVMCLRSWVKRSWVKRSWYVGSCVCDVGNEKLGVWEVICLKSRVLRIHWLSPFLRFSVGAVVWFSNVAPGNSDKMRSMKLGNFSNCPPRNINSLF